MTDRMSTSARLRETQQALAASQADLTRTEAELADLHHRRSALVQEAVWQNEQRIEGIQAHESTRLELLSVRAELASARQELAQRRAQFGDLAAQHEWIVARDGGRCCERCEAEIRRGEAYEQMPGSGGLLTHVHCPDSPPLPAGDRKDQE